MSAAIFDKGLPFGNADRNEGACADGGGEDIDGTCSEQPLLGAASSSDGSAGGRGSVTAGGVKPKGKGLEGRAGVDEARLTEHCAQFGGVFAHQCLRISQAILSKLKKKKHKQKKTTRAKFDSAIIQSGVCKWDKAATISPSSSSSSSSMAPGGNGCRTRGDCTIYSALSEIVVKGNLSLDSSSKLTAGAATDTIPQVVHLMFGMTPGDTALHEQYANANTTSVKIQHL